MEINSEIFKKFVIQLLEDINANVIFFILNLTIDIAGYVTVNVRLFNTFVSRHLNVVYSERTQLKTMMPLFVRRVRE